MLDVPSPTTSGENIELTCSYELDNEKLYSVKWYKNDEEFYRFVPADFPPGKFCGRLMTFMLIKQTHSNISICFTFV